MDNALMVGLQTQRVLQRRLDTTANNLANVATNGFKADALVFETQTKRPAHSDDKPHDITFVRDAAVYRDMSQGVIAATGNPLDLAIDGGGFFTVQGADGPLYTRDGAFTLAPDGTLVTTEGRPVLSNGGAPIVFDPRGEEPTIAMDGSIRMEGVEVGRLGIVDFPNTGEMEKVGDNLFSAGGQQSIEATGRVVQSALENSNVRAVVELTQLIEISRAYESAARFGRNGDDTRKSAIEHLGRA